MRKIFRISTLAVLALGAMAITASAQTKSVGLVAGANFATLNGDDVSDGSGTRTGFVGGLFVAIPVGGGNWYIEPEVLYSMQGATYDNSAFNGTLAVDYIRVPVLVKWVANPSGKGLYILLGPSVGFNVSCNDSGDASGGGSYDGTCEDEDFIKAKTVFSGDVGIGYTTGRFGIEGRYGWDWGDAFEVTGTGTAADGESLAIKNSVISVLLRFSK
jgi:hypothetical protein